MYIIKRYNGDESIKNGNGSVGHESWGRMGHGSPFLDGSRVSWVNASDPLIHNKITAHVYKIVFVNRLCCI